MKNKEELVSKVSSARAVEKCSLEDNEFNVSVDGMIIKGRVSELHDDSIKFVLPGSTNYESFVDVVIVSRQANGSFRMEATEVHGTGVNWHEKSGGLEKRIEDTQVVTASDLDEVVEYVKTRFKLH